MSSGAYRVKFKIEYPHATNDPPQDPETATWKRWKSYLLVEMAPLYLMLHTVNLFLKQVHHGLWDGTHVTMNERRVLRIGPRYDDDAIIEDGHKSYRHFLVKGLNKVSFLPGVQPGISARAIHGRDGGPSLRPRLLHQQDGQHPDARPGGRHERWRNSQQRGGSVLWQAGGWEPAVH